MTIKIIACDDSIHLNLFHYFLLQLKTEIIPLSIIALKSHYNSSTTKPRNQNEIKIKREEKEKKSQKAFTRQCFIFCHLICLHDGDVVYSVFPLLSLSLCKTIKKWENEKEREGTKQDSKYLQEALNFNYN